MVYIHIRVCVEIEKKRVKDSDRDTYDIEKKIHREKREPAIKRDGGTEKVKS